MPHDRIFEYAFLTKTASWESVAGAHRPIRFARLKQVHSATVLTVTGENLNLFLGGNPEADGYVTKLTQTALTIHTADCIPLLAVDPLAQVIGACHIGWRGVERRICGTFLEKLLDQGAGKETLLFFVGPHIRDCHFEVGRDIGGLLKDAAKPNQCISRHRHSDPEKEYISLSDIVTAQMEGAGIRRSQVKDVSTCTFCDSNYNSYRRDRGSFGRNESFIYLRAR